MKFTFVSAVNNRQVLNSCLLRSPDLTVDVELILVENAANASEAFNGALEKAAGEFVIFVHQDVFLPEGWLNDLESALIALEKKDPNWGVLGVYGITNSGEYHGHVFCTANNTFLGKPFENPQEVNSLDEIVLVLRRRSTVTFDNSLKGFHFYGTDICLRARALGKKTYAFPGFCIHNANGYGMFPACFWKSYLSMRSKWGLNLPVKTPCLEISKNLVKPLLVNVIWRFCWLRGGFKFRPKRVADPVALYRKLKDEREARQCTLSF